MARVLAVVPDLLFGSKVLEQLGAAGHDVTLCQSEPQAWSALEDGADVLLVDLTTDQLDGVVLVDSLRSAGALPSTIRTLAFYAHVDSDVKARAEAVGFDLVVPRSRMAREGTDLVARLVSGE